MCRRKSNEFRNWLRSNYCDQLLFGFSGGDTLPTADDILNSRSHSTMANEPAEFCTAIRSIANYTSASDTDRVDDGESLSTNGSTYDWDETTQDYTTRAYEEKDVAVEVVQPTATKTTAQKLLKKTKIKEYCVFCRNNDEPEYVYKSHPTRDVYNRIMCWRLRAYVCPICGETGDNAHTIKYCPKKPILTKDKIEARNRRSKN